MSRYLVTGGAGFIGSHLVDALLAAGHGVDVLDDLSTGRMENLPPQAKLIHGSVIDAALVWSAMAECDGCFHLAAVSSVELCNTDWIGTHEINMTGAITVLDAARARKTPVVYASSAAVFGNNQDLPLTESSHTQPLSAYGADKLGVELHAYAAWSVHGVPTTGFRFFNIYGPRQNPKSSYSGVISIFADRLAAGQGIKVFGDGRQTRDFVFVGDAVEAMVRAMRSPPSGATVLNVCTGRETSLLELAATLGRTLAIEPAIAFQAARPGDIARSVGDPGRLESQLGFRPAVSLEQGLSDLFSH